MAQGAKPPQPLGDNCLPVLKTGEFGLGIWASRAGSDDAGFVCKDDGLDAVAQAEFREHSSDVRLDGGVGHDEFTWP